MYIIKDWANNEMYEGKEFDSFDDAWSHIFEMNPDDDSDLDDFYVEIK